MINGSKIHSKIIRSNPEEIPFQEPEKEKNEQNTIKTKRINALMKETIILSHE